MEMMTTTISTKLVFYQAFAKRMWLWLGPDRVSCHPIHRNGQRNKFGDSGFVIKLIEKFLLCYLINIMVCKCTLTHTLTGSPDRLPAAIQAVHEQLPSIEEEDEEKRTAAIIAACEDKKEHTLVGMLARQMQEIAKCSAELPVARLLGTLLDFVAPKTLSVVYVLACLTISYIYTFANRVKPQLTFTAATGDRDLMLLVSRPDYGLRPTSGDVDFVSLASDVTFACHCING